MRKEEIQRILKECIDELRKFGVKKIGLFGSYARNEATESSDVDLVIEFEEGKATFRNFSAVVEFLENLLGTSVDLLTPAGVESIKIRYIKEKIMKEIEYV
ncbi:MAG: nucleotidyltransferase family protein [Methanosarcinales archaeon]